MLFISIATAASNDAVAEHVKILIVEKSEVARDALSEHFDEVSAFYKTRNYKPIWVRDNGPKSKGKSLLQELKRTIIHGLQPSFYRVDMLDKLIKSKDHDALAKLDLYLSGAFIAYSSDLKNGRIRPPEHSSINSVTPITTTADALVKGAADAGNFRNFAKLFLTTDDRYIRLIGKYLEYRRMEKSGDWPSIDPNGKPIPAGAKDDRIKDIRVALALSQDLPPNFLEGENVHDRRIVAAVKRFQQRHGYKETGDIDAKVLQGLSIPIKTRMTQILLNLERRRWQNRDLSPNHLYVNLADGNARLVIGGKKAGSFPVDGASDLPALFGTISKLTRDSENPQKVILSVITENSDGGGEVPLTLTVPKDWKPKKSFGKLVDNASNIVSEIKLNEPLEIYVTYLTVWANKNGALNIRPDSADRDGKLAAALGIK